MKLVKAILLLSEIEVYYENMDMGRGNGSGRYKANESRATKIRHRLSPVLMKFYCKFEDSS